MKLVGNGYDPLVRAREKEISRVADERALAAGRKSAAQLCRENEAFAAVAGSGRVNLAAAKSLA
jgi:hypothetical protein